MTANNMEANNMAGSAAVRNQAEGHTLSLRNEEHLHQRYVIKGVLGVGGFGITYKGYDVYNRSFCAIKELFINDSVTRAADGRTVYPESGKEKIFSHGIKRFMEEAEILHKLNGTPNVVNITDYFQENNTAYFVMEYIKGVTLGSLMRERGGKLGLSEAEQIIYKVGMTLENVYKKHSIIHRDLSPENILMNERGNPKIIDFGNAKTYIRNSGQSHSVVLKPGFAPPEQYTGRDQGPWTDVYSLAGIFYFAASGIKLPPSTERIAGAEYKPLAAVLPECPREISELTDKALALNPKDRIKSTGDFVRPMAASTAVVRDSQTSMRPPAQPSGQTSLRPPMPPSGQTSLRPPVQPQRQFPVLVTREAGSAELRWRLPEDTEVAVGRDAGICNIVVSKNPQISKKHLLIKYLASEQMYEVTDVSTNGVYLAGRRLEKGRTFPAAPESVLVLGNGICELKLGVMK